MRRVVRVSSLVLVTSTIVVLGPPARATVITVTTQADELNGSAPCSLREAIRSANLDSAIGGCEQGSGPDTIIVPPGLYPLSLGAPNEDAAIGGDLDITGDVTIQGAVAPQPGPPLTTVDGGGIDRVFDVGPTMAQPAVHLFDMTIQNGKVVVGDGGGGIQNLAVLEASRLVVIGNEAGYGGGVNSFGTGTVLTMTDSLVAGNVTVEDEEVAGGILNQNGGTATLTNLTISGNRTEGDGAGLWNEDATATLNNLTVTGNTADSDADGSGEGGGIVHDPTGSVTVQNSIVAGNVDASPVMKSNDCFGDISSGGHNLIQDVTGCNVTGDLTGNLSGANPKLGPLADNGGPTMTHALGKGSAAIDAGSPAPPGSGGPACAAADQRGLPRNCDIGAYELVLCRKVPVNRIGTTEDDNLHGTPGRDGFLAFGGGDRVFAAGGNDAACLGPGDDTASGAGGKDRLLGQAGNDRLFGGGGNDVLACGPGKDVGKGNAGKDRASACERGVP